jgi:hypothetical protein
VSDAGKDATKQAFANDPGAAVVYSACAADFPVAIARTIASPAMQASQTIYRLHKETVGLQAELLRKTLGAQIDMVQSGNMKLSEAFLVAQAHTLDSLFNHYVRAAQTSETLNQFEAKLRLALRAQAQCRATLETLAEIKNPRPVAFVQQANITTGPQQVNNGAPVSAQSSRAENSEIRPNELLEQRHGEWLDSGASSAATACNPGMATVAAVDRTTD